MSIILTIVVVMADVQLPLCSAVVMMVDAHLWVVVVLLVETQMQLDLTHTEEDKQQNTAGLHPETH